MKIAVVNNFFPPRPGGSSHLSDHLARAYAASGHEVLVLTASYRNAPEVEERDGFRIARIPAWILPKNRFAANFDIAFTIGPTSLSRVNRILDDFNPDVIHQHGQFFDLTWQTGLWARKNKVPTLLSVHTRLESPNPVHDLIYRMGDALLVKPMMRIHSPKLVVMDIHMDRYIKKRYRHAFRGTVAIPVGIEPEKLSLGDANVVRMRHGLVNGEHVILSVGHVIPQRSRMQLVEALPEILTEVPTARLLVIGGVYHDEFLHRARVLGVDGAIIAPGSVAQSEMPHYLAAADVEIHELEGTGFGTAGLEALAVGLPVVAAMRTDNFLDITVQDGRELFIAPPIDNDDPHADPQALAEVLIQLLKDPAGARAAVSQNAKDFINDHFTLDRVSERHLAVLEELVSSSRTTEG